MDAGYQQWLGLWPYAIIMVALVSWGFYRAFAPKSWHDWAGAGLVQAFVIALYAEMYGFPLTIYFLTGFLPIDIPLQHISGHLWATLLGYGVAGALIEMMIGYGFVLSGIVVIIRGWKQVYFSTDRLIRDGIYGVIRHPQYSGLFLIIIGQIIHWPTIPTLVLAPFIIALYVHLARREEANLVERFGDAYREYQSAVPMFMPRLTSLREGHLT